MRLPSKPQDIGCAYVEVQVDRDTWREAIRLLGSDAPWPIDEVKP